MAQIEGLTLSQIEDRVAERLLGMEFINSSTSGAGSTTTLVDTTNIPPVYGIDAANGRWLLFDSGSNDGSERQVTDDDGAGTLTFSPALGTATANADTYKMFTSWLRSSYIRNTINQAVTGVIDKYYKMETSIALHGDGVTTRFDIPSEFDAISKIEYRRAERGTTLHDCGRTFDETTSANITQAVDTEGVLGSSCLKLTVAAAAAAGAFITDSITSVDLSKYTHLEGWIKSSVALSAADYKIHLDSGVVQADGTDLESLNVPAVTADTKTFFRVALASPESDTAIVSVGIEMDQDKGAHVVYFDELRCVDDNSGNWLTLNGVSWNIDHENADLILTSSGRGTVGNSLMKIHGGSNPASMSTGATTATVPESYLVAKTCELLLKAHNDRDSDGRPLNEWSAFALEAEQERRRMRIPPNFRRVR